MDLGIEILLSPALHFSSRLLWVSLALETALAFQKFIYLALCLHPAAQIYNRIYMYKYIYKTTLVEHHLIIYIEQQI